MRACALLLLVVLGGCDAPGVAVDPRNDGALDDATIDAPDAPADVPAQADVRFPDGRPCEGHDEDGDGVPDECDDCPLLADRAQVVGERRVGEACAPSSKSPFVDASRRLFFDPFVEFSGFTSFAGDPSPFFVTPGSDVLTGGSPASLDDVPFVVSRKADAAGPRTTVATTILRMRAGLGHGEAKGGLLLRAAGDPKRFFACYVDAVDPPGSYDPYFAIAVPPATGCNGGPCALTPLPLGGVAITRAPVSSFLVAIMAKGPIGLRASITRTVGGSKTIECRVFDPAQPSSLLIDDPGYAIDVTDDEAWGDAGEVGFFAYQAQFAFNGIDVLVDEAP